MILQNHARVRDPFKMKDVSMEFDVTEYEKLFI